MSDLISRQTAIDDLYGRDPSQIWDTADIEVWINALPSAEPERKTPDRGYMWICPECGLEVHSDYARCVRCGWDRPSADFSCDGCQTPKHICGICRRNYPNITDHYCTGEAWREVKDETAV